MSPISSPRNFIIFVISEFVLAGILLSMRETRPVVFLVLGAILLLGIWAWDTWEKISSLNKISRQVIIPIVAAVILQYAVWHWLEIENHTNLGGEEDVQATIAKDFWTPLTDMESNALIEKLRPLASSKIVLTCSQIECRDLARSVRNAFEKAGWRDMNLSVGGIESLGIEGISISPLDETSRKLREIIESSTDLSVALSEHVRLETDYPATYIAIGPKSL